MLTITLPLSLPLTLFRSLAHHLSRRPLLSLSRSLSCRTERSRVLVPSDLSLFINPRFMILKKKGETGENQEKIRVADNDL